MSDLAEHLALALVPGLGPKLTAALLARFGSPAAALRASASELIEIPHIGGKLAAALAEAFRQVNPAGELELMAKHGVRAVPLGSADYPTPLVGTPGLPPLLFVRGDWRPEDANAIGIVGSRSCTSYGVKAAGQLARGLVRAGFTVISGLARGIDTAAHRGALEGGGRTIAVLAGGLSKIYPPENAPLAEEIVADRGCLITESSMRMEPQPGLFPSRNRIISGMSRAVIVVEANARSGALITAQHAAEQGREVYAVPGPIDSPASAGCLELIRTGARLVRSADDIVEDLRGLAAATAAPSRAWPAAARRFEPSPEAERVGAVRPPDPTPPPPPLPELSDTEQRVFDALAARRHADELAREAGLPVGELSRTLMLLELKKLVRRLPGNYYERR